MWSKHRPQLLLRHFSSSQVQVWLSRRVARPLAPRHKLYLDCDQMPKQTSPDLCSSIHFPSAANHQSVNPLQAVWLGGNEIGFTLQRTQHTVSSFFHLFFFSSGSRARCWSCRRGPTCSCWLGCRREAEGGERRGGSEETWRREREFACQPSGVERRERAFCYTCQTHEQSTSVHPLPPSSEVWKQGFLKKRDALISACVSPTASSVFHTRTHVSTHAKGESGGKQDGWDANSLCLQRYRSHPALRRPLVLLLFSLPLSLGWNRGGSAAATQTTDAVYLGLGLYVKDAGSVYTH